MTKNSNFKIYYQLDLNFFATKKGVGSTDNGRDSRGTFQRVHLYGGSFVKPGEAIVWRLFNKFHSGDGTYKGKTGSIHAKDSGIVKFKKKILKKGKKGKLITIISVIAKN